MGPESTDNSPDAVRRTRVPAAKKQWGLGDAVLGMGAGLVLSSLVASIWLGATGRSDLTLAGQAASQTGLWAGLVGATVAASRRKGTGRLADDFGLRLRPVDAVVGVLAGLAGQVVLVSAVAFLLSPLVGHPDVSGPVNDLVADASGLRFAGVVLFVAVGAPLVEELFFRGLLLRSLQRRLGDAAAIAVSAVLFGLAHLQALSAGGLLVVVTSLAVFGVVLALLAVRTGRLGPSMWAHAAFNAFTVVSIAIK